MAIFAIPANARHSRFAVVPRWRNCISDGAFVGWTITRGEKIKMSITRKSAVHHLTTTIAFVGMTICPFGCRDTGTSHKNDKAQSTGPTSSAASDGDTESYVKRLTADGWDQRAAESVVGLNAEWLAIQADENPAGLEIQLKLLGSLGKHSDLHGFLTDHPETAGLLAAAADPQLVADTLRTAANGGEYDRVAGLYVQSAAPRDAADVAQALKANHDLTEVLQSFRSILIESLRVPCLEVFR